MLFQSFLLVLISADLGKCPDVSTSGLRPPTDVTTDSRFQYVDCGTAGFSFATDKAHYSSLPANFFKGSKIKSVTISTEMTSIGSSAFEGTSITDAIDMTNAKKLETIDSRAFYEAQVSTITFPQNLETIGASAFELCKATGDFNFLHSTSLTSISGSNAFKGATIEGTFTWPPNLLTLYPSYVTEDNKDKCTFIDCTIDTLKLNSGTKISSIQSYAFYKVNIIKALTFPDELETIGSNAFELASLPSTLSFPSNLEQIRSSAFNHAKGLTSIEFSKATKLETIGSSAFKDIISLTTVDSIKCKTLGGNAFEGCRNMVVPTITILASGSLGGNAFLNCYALDANLIIEPAKDLDEEENLIYTSISASAFQNSGIKSVELPYLESIGSSAFENCTKLTGTGSISAENIENKAFFDDGKVAFSSINATNIKDSAFENCRNLDAEITIYYYGSIGQKAFKNCDKLKGLEFLFNPEDGKETKDKKDFEDKVHSISEEAFYRSGLSGALKIPITINNVGKNAFAHCTKLTSLTFDECDDESFLLTIQEKAFYRSNVGGKLILPYNTKIVQSYAFAYCPLTALEVHGTGLKDSSGAQVTTTLKDYAFYNCKINELTFTENDVSFETKTFRGCPLNKLQLGNIETIPEEAFYGMTTITSPVTIPDSVTEIEPRAFAGCSKLPSVSFGEQTSQLETLGAEAFYGCTDLSRINIPFLVTKIDEGTFYRCKSLSSINIGHLVTSIGKNAFYGCSGLTSELSFPIELEEILESAFEGCSRLTGSLEFPDSVTKVDKRAFLGCTSLSGHVTFGRSIGTIEEYAFRDCSGFIEQLTFPEILFNGVELSINNGAFYGCSGFTGDLVLPLGTTLSDDAFRGCSGFNGRLDLADITSVPNGAFRDCSGFTGNIPTKDLNTINKHAFHGCSSFTGPLDLSSLTATGDSVSINEYAFCDCRGLNGPLIIPQPFNKVEDYAFYGCSGLTGTLDCSKFTEIHRYAFTKCSGLNGELVFEKTLKFVEQSAFEGCSGFSNRLSFLVGSSKLQIHQCAFKDCSGFKNGKLLFEIETNEEDGKAGKVSDDSRYSPYYRYDYFLKIGNDAFDGTKFKNIYYLGRFEPDCDYDIGISQIKGIQTSSNYANKTFCNYPLHKSKLSGGAIAGIVIACVVVVAAIIILIVFLIMKAKKNKDKSEGEVEMNGD